MGRSQTTVSVDTVDGPDVVADALPKPTADRPLVTDPAVSAETAVRQLEVSTATERQEPVEVVTTALSGAASAFFNPFADDAPAPVESAAMWTLAAAARREFSAKPPSLDQPVNHSTHSLTTGDTLAATGGPVVAIEQTPPLGWLQQLPVVGPLFVTPIVAALHQIPIISDVLHPLIGYPVQFGLPSGHPGAARREGDLV